MVGAWTRLSVSGVQGTGKSTLARALGRAMGAVVLSRAPLMDVALAAGVPVDPPQDSRLKGVGDLAYDLQTALLREQLGMGHSVVLDCGADWHIRERWRKVADDVGAHTSGWSTPFVLMQRSIADTLKQGGPSGAAMWDRPGKWWIRRESAFKHTHRPCSLPTPSDP